LWKHCGRSGALIRGSLASPVDKPVTNSVLFGSNTITETVSPEHGSPATFILSSLLRPYAFLYMGRNCTRTIETQPSTVPGLTPRPRPHDFPGIPRSRVSKATITLDPSREVDPSVNVRKTPLSPIAQLVNHHECAHSFITPCVMHPPGSPFSSTVLGDGSVLADQAFTPALRFIPFTGVREPGIHQEAVLDVVI